MSESFWIFVFIAVTILLFLTCAVCQLWDEFIDQNPCEKCGKKLVLVRERYTGPAMGEGEPGSGWSRMVKTCTCLNRRCKHVRTCTNFTRPFPQGNLHRNREWKQAVFSYFKLKPFNYLAVTLSGNIGQQPHKPSALDRLGELALILGANTGFLAAKHPWVRIQKLL